MLRGLQLRALTCFAKFVSAAIWLLPRAWRRFAAWLSRGPRPELPDIFLQPGNVNP
jgi:hypothetical protein